MPTFKYAKLVRDNIVKWHVESGHTPKVRHLKGEALKDALCAKLHEEADEVGSAIERHELIEEIADVQQILDDLCTHEHIDKKEIEQARIAKFNKKGGFKKGSYIDTVTIPDENDQWARYCRQSPDKYPEVQE